MSVPLCFWKSAVPTGLLIEKRFYTNETAFTAETPSERVTMTYGVWSLRVGCHVALS